MNDDRLRKILRESPMPPNPLSGSELLARSRKSQALPGLQALAALLLLSGALAIGSSNDAPNSSLHARGAAESVELGFSFVVEGRSGLREKLATVPLDQQLIFIARTSRPGFLCIDEEVPGGWQRVFPQRDETWKVDVGEHHIARDGQVQAFSTDLGAGLRRYRLAFHAESSDCNNATTYRTTELLWTQP